MALLPTPAGSRPRGGPNMVKGGPSLNPSGRPPSVWQNPSIRAEQLVAKYSPEQIIKFAKNIKKAPLSSADAIIIIQLANILQLRDGIERERLYDRTFGKVPDRTINLNLNLDATPQQLSERALALLNSIAPREPEEIESEVVIEEDHNDDDDLVDEPEGYDDLVSE